MKLVHKQYFYAKPVTMWVRLSTIFLLILAVIFVI
uniref:Uncharacterized protein n=1 Tax=Anguilla anguilla TaxID=7936 RepID=A0A0E9T420_ANGAN